MPGLGLVGAGFNRAAQRIRRTGTGSSGGGGGSAPATPAAITAATPGARVMGWAGNTHAFQEMTFYDAWKQYYKGFCTRPGNAFLFGFGNTYQSRATTAAGLSGGTWDYQKAFEGLPSSINGNTSGKGCFQAVKNGIMEEAYCAIKMVAQAGYAWAGPSTGNPPPGYTVTSDGRGSIFGDWWDDAVWGEVCAQSGNRAAMVKLCGGTGINIDPEDQNKSDWDQGTGFCIFAANEVHDYGKPYGGHTLAQQKVQVEQRCYEWALAIYTAFRDCNILIYHWEENGGWYTQQAIDVLHRAGWADKSRSMRNQFFLGMMRAHAALNSHGKIILSDAWFYRYRTQYNFSPPPGSSVPVDTALHWSSQGPLSYFSQVLSQPTLDQVMPYIGFVTMSWAGTDGSGPGYDASQEDEPAWTQHQETYRRASMQGMRVEYNLDGMTEAAVHGLWTGHNNYSFPTNRLSNWLPTMSKVDNYSNVAPTHPTPSFTGSGASRTVTGVASHPTGIHMISGFVSPSGALTQARWVWNLHGGSPTAGIGAATADYTLTLTGVTPGSYAIVTAYSTQGQATSRVIGPF